MKDFKKGGFAKKPGFRSAPKRDFSSGPDMHQATCAQCRKVCEVPFKPNGKKPVLCRDCFGAGESRPAHSSSFSHGAAPERSFARSFSAERAPRQDSLAAQIEMLNRKIDSLTRAVELLADKRTIKRVK